MDKESAIFGVPSEDKIEVNADHSGICRFDTSKPQDKGTYQIVKTHIEDAMGASLFPAQPGTSDLLTPDRRSPLPQFLLEAGGSAGESSGWMEDISGRSQSRERVIWKWSRSNRE